MGNGALYMEDEEKNRKQREYYNKNLVKSREKKREYYHQNKEKIRKGKNMSMRKTYAKMNQEERKKKYSLGRLHLRIRMLKSRQKYCSICNQERKLELSNVDGIYSKNPDDYWWLCRECHQLYDRTNKTHKMVYVA